MHRTLKAETARPPQRNMSAQYEAQQERFDTWRAGFNDERPHEALGGETPTSHYVSSPRAMTRQAPAPRYPAHAEVRRGSRAGTFRFQSRLLFLSQALQPGA